MPVCAQCGNSYDKAFQLTNAEGSFWFDSFECAIEAVAPRCAHCQCRIIGHGMEANGRFFCCDHCAEHMGVEGLNDRV